MVFVGLKRRGKEVYYFKGKGECDFLIRDGINITGAIQVCTALTDKEILDREVKGLLEAMNNYNLDEGLIFNR